MAARPADTRSVRARVIDAFTDQPFRGNPAGVVLLDSDEWPDSSLMQSIASELGHETAFARRSVDDATDWSLRWFTPGSESNVCGHATLATTHALREDHRTALSLRFSSSYGVLKATAGEVGPITLDFPAAVLAETEVPPGLSAALGDEVDTAVDTGTLGDLLITLRDESTVRRLRPDVTVLVGVIEQHGLRGIIVTAPAERPGSYDFVSRYFAPATGIAEDPVTGSAHTALAPYWSARLGHDELVGLQASERSGLVRTTVRGERVLLIGDAVTVIDGQIALE